MAGAGSSAIGLGDGGAGAGTGGGADTALPGTGGGADGVSGGGGGAGAVLSRGGAVAARCLWNGEHEYLGNALTYGGVHAPFVYDFLKRYTKPAHVGKGEVDEGAPSLGSVVDSEF